MEEKLLYQDVARAMIEAARKHKFMPETLPVAPELAEMEKNLLVLLAGKIKEYSSLRDEAALDHEELQSLFTYVYARSAEAVGAWLGGNPFLPSSEGMFNCRTPFQAEEKLIELLKSRHLAECMYVTFCDWCERNPTFCAQHGIHPVLPLLEALKWTFRFGTAIVITFFEQKQQKQNCHHPHRDSDDDDNDNDNGSHGGCHHGPGCHCH